MLADLPSLLNSKSRRRTKTSGWSGCNVSYPRRARPQKPTKIIALVVRSVKLSLVNLSDIFNMSSSVKPTLGLTGGLCSVFLHAFRSNRMRCTSIAGKRSPCSVCHIFKPVKYLAIVPVETVLCEETEHQKMNL